MIEYIYWIWFKIVGIFYSNDNEISEIEMTKINLTPEEIRLYKELKETMNIDANKHDIEKIIKFLEKEEKYASDMLKIKHHDNKMTVDDILHRTKLLEFVKGFKSLQEKREQMKDKDWIEISESTNIPLDKEK